MTGPASKDCGCGDEPRTPEERIGREVESAIDELKRHEKKILEALDRPETRARFTSAPGAVLGELGLSVSGVLRHHLQRFAGTRATAVPPPGDVVLPNGQRITPRVRVRFTGSTKAGG